MMEANAPDLWRSFFPQPRAADHKYTRGHTAIFGSDRFTGATRLAAEACSRIGSGLVTVCNTSQADLYRVTLPADVMIAETGVEDLRNVNAILAGPGGLSETQAAQLLETDPKISLVLDADAIRLKDQCKSRSVIFTPHRGEFEHHFGAIGNDVIAPLRAAAAASENIIILKGAETLIAAPEGQMVASRIGTPYLAKAGTGDVLAGFIAGLVAQGMPHLHAACAGVWIHGRASERIGPGLVPQDLLSEIRPILREILA